MSGHPHRRVDRQQQLWSNSTRDRTRYRLLVTCLQTRYRNGLHKQKYNCPDLANCGWTSLILREKYKMPYAHSTFKHFPSFLVGNADRKEYGNLVRENNIINISANLALLYVHTKSCGKLSSCANILRCGWIHKHLVFILHFPQKTNARSMEV